MSYPTVNGQAVEGITYREAQSCLGRAFAGSTYRFFLTGTSTPANVYQNGALTTPFPITGLVASDNFGRFPAIYLDTSVIYKVQFFDGTNTLRWTVNPYIPPLSTVGTSSLSAFGFQIAPTGEIVIPAPNSGGSGVALTLNSGSLGSTPLRISATQAGNSALIVNSSATTGAQTATFAATNKPGTAASSPAGWLPITCDGVQYYAPIWHGNPFTPYAPNPSALGEAISAQSILFGGNGLTTVTGGAAAPSNWFVPVTTNVGAGFWINITKTSGLSGVVFTENGSPIGSAWVNITGSGLTISSNAQATIQGSYNLSTSSSGTPVVASGFMQISNNNGVQSLTINGVSTFIFAGDGESALGGGAVPNPNWFTPTTANIGSGFWVNITQTGGTPGATFSAASGAWTNITNAGIAIGISGGSGLSFNVTGTYIIASDSAGVNRLGSGTITLTGGSNVQSPNWSGTTPLKLNGNGSATLNGASTSDWLSPNVSNVGSGFWINITRTSGTAGVNFTAAQGSWTNITNSGLTIDMNGFTGDVGIISVNGTYQISNSSSGTPVLGSGTVSLSVNAGSVTRTYTSAVTGATETVPTGASFLTTNAIGAGGSGASSAPFTPVTTTFTTAGANVITIPSGATSMTLEIEGGGGGGGGSSTSVVGNGGSSGGRCVSTYALTSANVGQTLTLTCGASKASLGVPNGSGQIGNASTVVAGTFTGFTTMTANGGGGGFGSLGGAGPGGTATGGDVTNQSGNTNSTQQAGAAGLAGTFINGRNGAAGANHPGSTSQPDTDTTIGQGAVSFSGGSGTAGGGGGGALVVSAGVAVTGGQTFTYTVGAAAAGSSSSTSNGNAGGTSSVTGTGVAISAGGGSGGQTTGTGGAGGAASGGNTTNTAGQSGAASPTSSGGNNGNGAGGGTPGGGSPGGGSAGVTSGTSTAGGGGQVQFVYT